MRVSPGGCRLLSHILMYDSWGHSLEVIPDVCECSSCLNNKLNFHEESWMLLFLSKRKYIAQVKKWNNRNIDDGVQLSKKFWRICAKNFLPFWQFCACVWGEILKSENDLAHLHCILQRTTVNVVDYTDFLSDMWEAMQSLKRLWTISYSPYKPKKEGPNIHDNVNLNLLAFLPSANQTLTEKPITYEA